MTKRALSLLLTLVMVLSLCVPALAAEDFEAEAPAEVVEEAPKAPEAPVAPEAEEPAEEPVADEPVAEEAVEDAPEAAALIDEPEAIKVDDVTKHIISKLEFALEKADAYKARVEAGELFGGGTTNDYDGIDQDTSRTATFDAAYEEVERNLDGINAQEIIGDVTQKSAETAAADLLALIPADFDDVWPADTVSGHLTNVPTAAMNDDLDAAVDLADELYESSYKDANETAFGNTIAVPALTDGFTASAFDTAEWMEYYPADYLDAMKAATKAAAAYTVNPSKTYKDFVAVEELIIKALDMEAAAALPTQADADALEEAIADAKTTLKSTGFTTTPANYYAWDGSKFDTIGAGHVLQTTFESNLKIAESMLNEDSLSGNGFNTTVTYHDYLEAMKYVQLIAKDDTAKVKGYTFKAEPDEGITEITVEIAIMTGVNKLTDYKMVYKYNDVYKTNGGAADQTSTKTETQFEFSDIVDASSAAGTGEYLGYTIYKVVLKPLQVDGVVPQHFNTVTSPKDTVNIKLYFTGKGSPTVNETIAFPKEDYAGPVFDTDKPPVFTSGSGAVTGINEEDYPLSTPDTYTVGAADSLSINFKGKFVGAYDPSDTSNTTVQIVLVSKDNKDLFVRPLINSVSGSNVSFTLDETSSTAITKTIAAGMKNATATGMKLELRFKTKTGETAPVAHDGCSIDVTFPALSTWTQGMKDLKSAVNTASKLVKGDFEYDKTGSGLPTATNLDTAWASLQTAITNGQKIIDNAGNLVNCQYQRGMVGNAIKDLAIAFSYLKAKESKFGDLEAAITSAGKLDFEDYTYATWIAFQKAYNAAKKVLNQTPAADQAAVDAAEASLEAAVAGLKAFTDETVDASALKTAIDNAKALKEADYTPESWKAAALADAIKAAETVANNVNATQAAIDAAKAALDAAVAKLVKVTPEEPEGPKAPASGTGWNYYNNEWYFFKNGKLVSNYWVGKIDGASQWDSNWYYVGSDGKMLTGMQYLDDLHGGYGWYFLQPTNTKQEIGKMLTGYQWVGGQYGECYFSKASGSSGKCTWSELLGNWNGTTWVK